MEKLGCQSKVLMLILSMLLSSCINADSQGGELERNLLSRLAHEEGSTELITDIEKGKLNPAFAFPSGMTVLEASVVYGNKQVYQYLIAQHWEEVKGAGNKALELACANGRLEAMEVILEQGVDPNKVLNGHVDSICIFTVLKNLNAEAFAVLNRYKLDGDIRNSAGITAKEYMVQKLKEATKINELLNTN